MTAPIKAVPFKAVQRETTVAHQPILIIPPTGAKWLGKSVQEIGYQALAKGEKALAVPSAALSTVYNTGKLAACTILIPTSAIAGSLCWAASKALSVLRQSAIIPAATAAVSTVATKIVQNAGDTNQAIVGTLPYVFAGVGGAVGGALGAVGGLGVGAVPGAMSGASGGFALGASLEALASPVIKGLTEVEKKEVSLFQYSSPILLATGAFVGEHALHYLGEKPLFWLFNQCKKSFQEMGTPFEHGQTTYDFVTSSAFWNLKKSLGRPKLSSCLDEELFHFIHLPLKKREKVLSAVCASDVYDTYPDEVENFKKASLHPNEMKEAARELYSRYLYTQQAEQIRLKPIQATEEELFQFFGLSKELQDEKIHLVFQSRIASIGKKRRAIHEKALIAYRKGTPSHEDMERVKDLVWYTENLRPRDYLLLTQGKYQELPDAQKMHYIDVVRTHSTSLGEKDLDALSRLRHVRYISDYRRLSHADQKILDAITIRHFNTLPAVTQEQVIDINEEEAYWLSLEPLRKSVIALVKTSIHEDLEVQKVVSEIEDLVQGGRSYIKAWNKKAHEITKLFLQSAFRTLTTIDEHSYEKEVSKIRNLFEKAKTLITRKPKEEKKLIAQPKSIFATKKKELNSKIRECNKLYETLVLHQEELQQRMHGSESPEEKELLAQEEMDVEEAKITLSSKKAWLELALIESNKESMRGIQLATLPIPPKTIDLHERGALQKVDHHIVSSLTTADVQLLEKLGVFVASSWWTTLTATSYASHFAAKTLENQKLHEVLSFLTDISLNLLSIDYFGRAAEGYLAMNHVTFLKDIEEKSIQYTGNILNLGPSLSNYIVTRKKSVQDISKLMTEAEKLHDIQKAKSSLPIPIETNPGKDFLEGVSNHENELGISISTLLERAHHEKLAPHYIKSLETIRESFQKGHSLEVIQGHIGQARKAIDEFGDPAFESTMSSLQTELNTVEQSLLIPQEVIKLLPERLTSLKKTNCLFPNTLCFSSQYEATKEGKELYEQERKFYPLQLQEQTAQKALSDLHEKSQFVSTLYNLAPKTTKTLFQNSQNTLERIFGQSTTFADFVSCSLKGFMKVQELSLESQRLLLGIQKDHPTTGLFLPGGYTILSLIAQALLKAGGGRELSNFLKKSGSFFHWLSKASWENRDKEYEKVYRKFHDLATHYQAIRNKGRYIDDSRIKAFLDLSKKEQAHIEQLVQSSSFLKEHPEMKEKLLFFKKEMDGKDSHERKLFAETLLIILDHLGPDDFLLTEAEYNSDSLEPFIKDRIKDLVRRFSSLRLQKKTSSKAIVQAFNELPADIKKKIHEIPLFEYQLIPVSKQEEIIFAIAHSTAFKMKFREKEGRDPSSLELFETFIKYKTNPSNDELEELLSLYPQLEPQDISRPTPNMLEGFSESRILHILDLLQRYRGKEFGIFEAKGKERKKLWDLTKLPPIMKDGKKTGLKAALLEITASLLHSLNPLELKELASMNPDEVRELSFLEQAFLIHELKLHDLSQKTLTKTLSDKEISSISSSFNAQNQEERLRLMAVLELAQKVNEEASTEQNLLEKHIRGLEKKLIMLKNGSPSLSIKEFSSLQDKTKERLLQKLHDEPSLSLLKDLPKTLPLHEDQLLSVTHAFNLLHEERQLSIRNLLGICKPLSQQGLFGIEQEILETTVKVHRYQQGRSEATEKLPRFTFLMKEKEALERLTRLEKKKLGQSKKIQEIEERMEKELLQLQGIQSFSKKPSKRTESAHPAQKDMKKHTTLMILEKWNLDMKNALQQAKTLDEMNLRAQEIIEWVKQAKEKIEAEKGKTHEQTEALHALLEKTRERQEEIQKAMQQEALRKDVPKEEKAVKKGWRTIIPEKVLSLFRTSLIKGT